MNSPSSAFLVGLKVKIGKANLMKAGRKLLKLTVIGVNSSIIDKS
jgi:hypothetical protein